MGGEKQKNEYLSHAPVLSWMSRCYQIDALITLLLTESGIEELNVSRVTAWALKMARVVTW